MAWGGRNRLMGRCINEGGPQGGDKGFMPARGPREEAIGMHMRMAAEQRAERNTPRRSVRHPPLELRESPRAVGSGGLGKRGAHGGPERLIVAPGLERA